MLKKQFKSLTIYFLPLVVLLSSCFDSNEKVYWKNWHSDALKEAKKLPIALLLYSSLDPDNSKIIKNKQLAQTLRQFSLYSIDIEEYPQVVRRYGTEIPCISILDKNGNNYFTIPTVDSKRIQELVPKLIDLSKQNAAQIPVSQITKGLSNTLLYPGEEREITETISKKIKKSVKNVELSLLSFAHRESGDDIFKKLLISELNRIVIESSFDPIAGGIWNKNGNIKRLKDLANYLIKLYDVSFYNPKVYTLIQKNIEISTEYFINKLERPDTLYNSAISFTEPYNLTITENELTNLLGTDSTKDLEDYLSLSYPKLRRGKRYVLFSNRVVPYKNLNNSYTNKSINLIRDKLYNENSYKIEEKALAIDNILLARLFTRLSLYNSSKYSIDKAISLKNKIYEHFKTDSNLIKTSSDHIPFFNDQIEYLKLLIEIYNVTLDMQDLSEAANFSKIILSSFCEMWEKVAVCSDLAFKDLYKNVGYFSLPDYSILLNSKLAMTLIQLNSLTKEKSLFDITYKILSAFKERAKKLITKKEVPKSLMEYTKAVFALYSNPLEVYIIMSKSKINEKFKEKALTKAKQQIYRISHPSILVKTINNESELYNTVINKKGFPKNIKYNSLVLCLEDKCKISSPLNINDNISNDIEDFLKENKDKVVRILPYW